MVALQCYLLLFRFSCLQMSRMTLTTSILLTAPKCNVSKIYSVLSLIYLADQYSITSSSSSPSDSDPRRLLSRVTLKLLVGTLGTGMKAVPKVTLAKFIVAPNAIDVIIAPYNYFKYDTKRFFLEMHIKRKLSNVLHTNFYRGRMRRGSH